VDYLLESTNFKETKNKKALEKQALKKINIAEREGFEPPDSLHRQRFSRPPHSTTLPPLQYVNNIISHLGSRKIKDLFPNLQFYFVRFCNKS
jgi:hypothetical protein